MRLEIERTARAEADLIEIYAHLYADSPLAADRFLESARTTFDFLAGSPRAGHLYLTNQRALRGLRVWPVHGFRSHLIFYLPHSSRLRVVRVIHGARDLRTILGGR